MEKTVWQDTKAMITDYDTLVRNLNDMRTVLACIAMQQEDMTLQIPFEALRACTGVTLEVTVDSLYGNFIFKAVLADVPAVPEGSGLAANDHVAGGLG